MRLTGGEQPGSFGRKKFHCPLEARWSFGQDEWRRFAAEGKTLRCIN